MRMGLKYDFSNNNVIKYIKFMLFDKSVEMKKVRKIIFNVLALCIFMYISSYIFLGGLALYFLVSGVLVFILAVMGVLLYLNLGKTGRFNNNNNNN